MAAKKGKKGGTKGKGPSTKGKSHEAKVASAMNTLNNNRTPLSSILPMQKIGSFRTSDKKGDRNFKSFGPSKMLLATTSPGSRPTAPRETADPQVKNGSAPTAAWLNANNSTSYGQSKGAKGMSWDSRHPAYRAEYSQFQRAISARNSYEAADNAYRNTDLPNWTTADAEYTKSTSKNTSKTSEYTKDLATFFNQKGKSRKSSSSGSRNVSSGRGTRR